MKKNNIITLVSLFCVSSVFSQNTLIVYTKFPTQLNFIDAFNKVIPKKPIWNAHDGGYVVNYDDLENTYITAENTDISFKLSDKSKLTNLISLESNSRVSVQKCFTSEKYCCEKLSDKQKKGTEKIMAISVMKKAAVQSMPIIFSETSKNKIYKKEDLFVSWSTQLTIKNIYIVDLNTLDIIWKADNYTLNNVTYSKIKNELTKPLITDHKYQLSIITNTEDIKTNFDFEYSDLIFLPSDYNFPTQDAVVIQWESTSKITKITLVDNSTSKEIWNTTTINSNTFIFNEQIKNHNLIPGNEYSLSVLCDNKKTYTYTFTVLLDSDTSNALKEIASW
ncbi:MAG: hypothetical protein SNJ71_02500 [Bacteroidales bacterium]